MRFLLMLMTLLMLLACKSENEHFCARYQYVYDQLLADDNPSYSEMRQQLQLNVEDQKKNNHQAKFMLFVLEDWNLEIKPEGEDSKDFCIRSKRWEQYH
ncbi:MAG: hypothetical protein ACI92E_002094 [Oceanicoccus sp.]|jgi:hypothetical protein